LQLVLKIDAFTQFQFTAVWIDYKAKKKGDLTSQAWMAPWGVWSGVVRTHPVEIQSGLRWPGQARFRRNGMGNFQVLAQIRDSVEQSKCEKELVRVERIGDE
jgi:hypothetical protein